MKISMYRFVVVFLAITRDARGHEPDRVPSEFRSTDVLGVVQKSRVFAGFWRTMDATFEIYDFRIKAGTVRRKLVDADKYLGYMNYVFMKQSYVYLKRNMLDFCKLALRIIEANGGDSPGDVRRLIGSLDDQKYCVMTAFHGMGFGLDFMFEMAVLFQTCHAQDECPLHKLDAKLQEYVEMFTRDLSRRGYFTVTPEVEAADLLPRIKAVKREITDFSNIFCSYWRPFASHVFNTQTVLDDVSKDARFISYVFRNVKCLIIFRTYTFYNFIPQGDGEHILIKTWDCGMILDNEEYRSQKPEEVVTIIWKRPEEKDMVEIDVNPDLTEKKQTEEKTGLITEKFSQVIHLVCYPKANIESSESDEESIGCESDGIRISLATLKQELKSNSKCYRNLLKYYNVASDVMLLASVKEGLKMLRGIKRELQRNGNEITVDDIRGLKSTLSLFKSSLDKLVAQILDKQRIDVGKNPHWVEFDGRVNSLVKSLEIRARDQVQQICGEVLKKLGDINCDNDENLVNTEFNAFYFTDPIRHVTQLSHFVENNFS